jgi:DNA invertase Pin-like site-specific DNA recombinase
VEALVAGQRIGYVRVSTLDQNEKRQLDGQILDRVFTDKASGRDTSRPELAELLRFARDGDTVVVHMDRLARNLDELRSLVQTLTCKGVRVEFIKESLVFTARTLPWPTSCSP